MLTLAGFAAATLRNDRRRQQTCAAFGAAEPPAIDRYLAIDLVAMGVRDQLAAQSMNLKQAAAVTRSHFDIWAACVSRIEHLHEPVVFVIGHVGGKKWWAIPEPVPIDQLQAGIDQLRRSNEIPQRLFVVNLTKVMLDIELRARNAGITVGGFFLPPDDPQCQQWIVEFRAMREQAQAKADPFYKPPRGPSPRQRQVIEDVLCGRAIH